MPDQTEIDKAAGFAREHEEPCCYISWHFQRRRWVFGLCAPSRAIEFWSVSADGVVTHFPASKNLRDYKPIKTIH